MQHFILRNWLILAIASFLVGLFIVIFEGFIAGKAYMFFLLALIFGAVFYLQKKKSG